MEKRFDVVVVGAGRVGLPLALSLEESGWRVAVKEKDLRIVEAIRGRCMPFYEPGYEELVTRSNIEVFSDEIPIGDTYVVTVGTPLRQHIESNLDHVKRVIDELLGSVDITDKLIVLRSTVSPNTSEYLRSYMQQTAKMQVGKDFLFATCPERIAEGRARVELRYLPQIIGVQDDRSYERAKELFLRLLPTERILRATFLEAELSKLFCNIYRYINFAIPNYFTMISQSFGVEPFHLFDVMNKDYPRNEGLRRPGLTAGACLRKDFGMISEFSPHTDMLLQAFKVNEFMAKFCVDLVCEKLPSRRVGVVGYTFKANSDDTRDSLVPKLIRYIERRVPASILVSDYNLPAGQFVDSYNDSFTFENHPTAKVLVDSEIVFLAMNHDKYYEIDEVVLQGKVLVDPWRILHRGIVSTYPVQPIQLNDEDVPHDLEIPITQ